MQLSRQKTVTYRSKINRTSYKQAKINIKFIKLSVYRVTIINMQREYLSRLNIPKVNLHHSVDLKQNKGIILSTISKQGHHT